MKAAAVDHYDNEARTVWDAAGNLFKVLYGNFGIQVYKFAPPRYDGDGELVLNLPREVAYYFQGVSMAWHVGKAKIAYQTDDTWAEVDIPGFVKFAPLVPMWPVR